MRLFFIFLLIPNLLLASELYHFEDDHLQKRFAKLCHELRCIECEHQSIAESFTRLSQDIKGVVYVKLQQGQSDAEIIGYLQSRYGEQIYSAPSQIWILWLLPIIFLLTLGGWQLLAYSHNEH